MPPFRQRIGRICNALRGHGRLAFSLAEGTECHGPMSGVELRQFSGTRPLPIPSAIAALLVSVLLVISGNGLITTLLPLRAKIEAFPDVSIGLIGSAYFVGMLAGTLAAPSIVRHAGHIRAYCAFVSVAIVVALTYPIATRPEAWIALRCIIGFAFAGLYAVIESWVNAKATNETRGRVYAIYQVVNFIGSAVGQQMLAFGQPTSFMLFSVTAAFFALSILPLALTKADPPGEPGSVRLRLIVLSNTAPVAVAAAFICGAANGSFWSLAPVFILGVGFTAAAVPTFITALIVGSALAVYPFGRLSDKVDRRIVATGLAAAAAVAEVALFFASGFSIAVLSAIGFVVGATSMSIYSLAASHANDRMGSQHGVEVASGLLFLYCAGAIIAPTITSALMLRFGPGTLFAANAAMHLALAIFIAWRIAKRAPAVQAPIDDRVRVRKGVVG